MRVRLLHHAGWLEGFDLGLRECPSWEAISKIIGVADAIEEMRNDKPTVNTREGFGGDTFAPSTLTRSMEVMSSHDNEPSVTHRPADPSGRSRRRSRVLSGGLT
jgi:hypothetical protein